MYTNIPNPDAVFPNEYGTTCFIKNVITAPNIFVGDYTYYDDPAGPAGFEKNNVLFNYPEFGDKLIIGKFCAIASGARFIMGPANHRLSSVTTYPFHVFGGNPARFIKNRFSDSMTELLLRLKWWDFDGEALLELLPLLCDPNLPQVEETLKARYGL